MLVDVYSGNTKTYLGRGQMNEFVTVYLFDVPIDDIFLPALLTLDNPEEKPPDELVEELRIQGVELREVTHNPKIVMEDGEVYYGCQIYWEQVKENKDARV